MAALRERAPAALGAAAALALAAGCLLLGEREPEGLAFSHRVHVVGQGLACESCHESLAVSPEPGMPTWDACVFCHELVDEEKPPERRAETLFSPDGAYLAAAVSRLDDEVVFDHLRHVEAGVACGACHDGIEESERLDAAIAVPMAECTACHERRELPSDCATCHTEIDETWAPPSHHHAWERRHGDLSRVPAVEPSGSCFLCHTESSCADCHRITAPADHGPHWRLQAHGIASRMDRARCAACHQPTDCERCHAEALPRSHTGMWGGTQSFHCLGCHFPLAQNGCAACHKATPSHLLAPPKPAWHTPAMNCRACHGTPTLPLSHVEKGDDCNLCHF